MSNDNDNVSFTQDLDPQHLDQLNKQPDASEKEKTMISSGSALHINELANLSSKYLTEKAKKDLSNVVTIQHTVGIDGKNYRAMYFSVVTKTGNEELGVSRICSVLNDLSEQNLIYACLSPVSSLQLVITSLDLPQSAVFCFVLVPLDKFYELVDKYKNDFGCFEGSVGRTIEDVRRESKDGEFFAEIAVSHMLILQEKLDPKGLLQNQIDLYLSILPKGTEVRETIQYAVIDLSHRCGIRLFNPLMKSVKYVELDSVRLAEKVNENRVECFDLLIGVKYFDADRKQLFV